MGTCKSASTLLVIVYSDSELGSPNSLHRYHSHVWVLCASDCDNNCPGGFSDHGISPRLQGISFGLNELMVLFRSSVTGPGLWPSVYLGSEKWLFLAISLATSTLCEDYTVEYFLLNAKCDTVIFFVQSCGISADSSLALESFYLSSSSGVIVRAAIDFVGSTLRLKLTWHNKAPSAIYSKVPSKG